MDVTQLKTQRKSLRTSFTLSAKVIEEELMKKVPNVDELSILKMQLSDKFSRLEKCQRGLSNIILKEETDELAYEEDFMKAEIYIDRFSEICAKIERLSVKETGKKEVPEKRKFKLPKIELKKFEGNAKEYLTFWAVVSNSKVARVVESFHATVENYPKAKAQLQERFGREHLLVQIYVRDLLSMVMRKAATGRSKTDLPALYDEREAKIRALESLGWTQDKELWNLESIGIFDPIHKLNEKNEHLKVIEEFKNSMKYLPDGRYELCLPFISEAIDLSSNKDLTWKRHIKMCERAQQNGILDDYKVVFKEWEELEIIEKIEEKDPNLIEQIPDILDRFRRYPIGLSAKIEKAFLQLGITPKHTDFLRFFYLDEGEEIVYRHCRVVFGVSSSPFLLAAVLVHLQENVPADDTQLGSKLKLSFYVDICVTGVNDIAQQEEFILRSRISYRKKGQLSLDESESAEIQLIRSVQAQSFTDEKLISNLSAFRDENIIIRVKT
ncbi:DUF1758 domain-containing protein [Trichonephila clavipes]|nr:DUF1758 domain-containing protein [Trichonephila clavipes]